DPSVFGQPVVFTATIAPAPPGAGTPTGTVTFTIDGDVVPVLLDENGTATLTRAVLPAGTYSVTADYGGDTNFTASTGTDTHTVNQATTTTTVTSSPDPTPYGEPVLFTAVVAPVAPGASTPTGTVTFAISGGPTLVASVDASGTASVSTSALPAGDYSVTATYSGDANFTASTGTDTHTVTRAATQTVLTSNPDPSVYGQEVLFTAVVTPISLGVGTPTGTVTFTDSSGATITVPLDANGVATVPNSALTAGSYSGTAIYNGDANFAPSEGSDTHIVEPAATTTTISSPPDPSVFCLLYT
ncbi:Ig-like domain-containing protein, partial [Streptomyces sp. GC420]|uniref:Ig-like domain-containing protein n=1 Tax=Streptomyces sp. GC420 TaxID=2697568 RepID=UPI001414D6A4